MASSEKQERLRLLNALNLISEQTTRLQGRKEITVLIDACCTPLETAKPLDPHPTTPAANKYSNRENILSPSKRPNSSCAKLQRASSPGNAKITTVDHRTKNNMENNTFLSPSQFASKTQFSLKFKTILSEMAKTDQRFSIIARKEVLGLLNYALDRAKTSVDLIKESESKVIWEYTITRCYDNDLDEKMVHQIGMLASNLFMLPKNSIDIWKEIFQALHYKHLTSVRQCGLEMIRGIIEALIKRSKSEKTAKIDISASLPRDTWTSLIDQLINYVKKFDANGCAFSILTSLLPINNLITLQSLNPIFQLDLTASNNVSTDFWVHWIDFITILPKSFPRSSLKPYIISIHKVLSVCYSNKNNPLISKKAKIALLELEKLGKAMNLQIQSISSQSPSYKTTKLKNSPAIKEFIEQKRKEKKSQGITIDVFSPINSPIPSFSSPIGGEDITKKEKQLLEKPQQKDPEEQEDFENLDNSTANFLETLPSLHTLYTSPLAKFTTNHANRIPHEDQLSYPGTATTQESVPFMQRLAEIDAYSPSHKNSIAPQSPVNLVESIYELIEEGRYDDGFKLAVNKLQLNEVVLLMESTGPSTLHSLETPTLEQVLSQAIRYIINGENKEMRETCQQWLQEFIVSVQTRRMESHQ